MSNVNKNANGVNGKSTSNPQNKAATKTATAAGKEKELQKQLDTLEKKLNAEREATKKAAQKAEAKTATVEEAIEKGQKLQAITERLKQLKSRLDLVRGIKLASSENAIIRLENGGQQFATSNQDIFQHCVEFMEKRLLAAIREAEQELLELC